MKSRGNLDRSLRRLKPEKRTEALAYRSRAQLLFIVDLKPPYPKLLLDSTVYVDALQNKIPKDVETAMRASSLWHSSVTEAELSTLGGLLSPTKPDTQMTISQIATSIDERPVNRILTPDREVWREAGIVSGLMARLQRYDKNERRKALNDGLIFLSGAKHGCSVLTRNIAGFDLLMQLDPRGQAIFYDRD